MSIPTSGCLHLCNPAVTGQSRSIAHVVYGASPPATVSLLTMGGIAGFVAPIMMTCFYGYSPLTTITLCSSLNADEATLNGFTGSIDLRCSNGTIICTLSIPSISPFANTIFTVSSGCYFYHFNVVAYDKTNSGVPYDIFWAWTNCLSSGTVNTTSCVNQSDFVSASIWSGIV